MDVFNQCSFHLEHKFWGIREAKRRTQKHGSNIFVLAFVVLNLEM